MEANEEYKLYSYIISDIKEWANEILFKWAFESMPNTRQAYTQRGTYIEVPHLNESEQARTKAEAEEKLRALGLEWEITIEEYQWATNGETHISIDVETVVKDRGKLVTPDSEVLLRIQGLSTLPLYSRFTSRAWEVLQVYINTGLGVAQPAFIAMNSPQRTLTFDSNVYDTHRGKITLLLQELMNNGYLQSAPMMTPLYERVTFSLELSDEILADVSTAYGKLHGVISGVIYPTEIGFTACA